MTKEQKASILENRIKIIEARGKDNTSLVNSLKRELRNMRA